MAKAGKLTSQVKVSCRCIADWKRISFTSQEENGGGGKFRYPAYVWPTMSKPSSPTTRSRNTVAIPSPSRRNTSSASSPANRKSSKNVLSVDTRVDDPSNGNGPSHPALGKIANTNAAASQKEVKAIREVLEVQQKDNYRLRDHVKMLDIEIDQLREFLMEKQDEINDRELDIMKLTDRVEELEREVKEKTVTRDKFITLQTENEKCKEETMKAQSELEDRLFDIKKLEDEVKDLNEGFEAKKDIAIEQEAKFTATLAKLREDLYAMRDEKDAAIKQFDSMRQEIRELKNNLKHSEDNRRDAIERSRQSEYRTMQRAEETLQQLHVAMNEKEKLSETLELSSFRGDMLQERLTHVLEETDDTKNAAVIALGKLEDVTAVARLRERALKRENDNLRAKLKETTRTLEAVTGKLGKTKKKMLQLELKGNTAVVKKEKGDTDSKGEIKKGRKTITNRPHNNSEKGTPRSSNQSVNEDTIEPPALFVSSKIKDESDTPRVQEDAIDLIGRQQSGKQRILARYMSILGDFYHHIDVIPYQIQTKLSEIDFSSCSLTDSEFSEICNWLRFIPLHCVAQIDLSNNLFSKACLETLFSYILSLPYPDLVRSEFLYVIMTNCRILSSDIVDLARKLSEAKTPGIKLVAEDIVGESIVVTIYGFTSHERSDVSAVIKLEFSNNDTLSVKTVKKPEVDVDGICYAHRRGRCKRGDDCPFPHQLVDEEKLKISQVVQVPVIDRFFLTSANDVNVSNHQMRLPGLTSDDRVEYEKIQYPRNSIM